MSTPAAPSLSTQTLNNHNQRTLSQPQKTDMGTESQLSHSDTDNMNIDNDCTSHDTLHDLIEALHRSQYPEY